MFFESGPGFLSISFLSPESSFGKIKAAAIKIIIKLTEMYLIFLLKGFIDFLYFNLLFKNFNLNVNS